jgi:hypothetical protein
VNPANAMGTFIRTWRAEWAGLSRAQLAIAVNGRLRGARRISGGTVQRWEEGQPPKSTEEFEALCALIQSCPLPERTPLDFRRAVFAACAARQYPDMLAGEPLAERADVEELARHSHQRPTEMDFVGLVASVAEMEDAVSDPAGAGLTGARLRRAEVALALLRATLAEALSLDIRWPWTYTASLFARNADFIADRFGLGGLGGSLSVLGQRIREAWCRGHHGRSVAWSERIVELSRAAAARGETGQAGCGYILGMHALGETQDGAYATLALQARRHLEAVLEIEPHERGCAEVPDIVWAALAEGYDDEADAWLEAHLGYEIRGWRGSNWHGTRAWIAIGRSDYDEAEARLATVARVLDADAERTALLRKPAELARSGHGPRRYMEYVRQGNDRIRRRKRTE